VLLDGEAANEQVLLVHEPRQMVHVITKGPSIHPYISVNNHTNWEQRKHTVLRGQTIGSLRTWRLHVGSYLDSGRPGQPWGYSSQLHSLPSELPNCQASLLL
jgi:hypothetical protein